MSREIQNNLTENESQKGQDAYGEGGALTQAKLEAQDSASSLSKYGMHGVGFKLEDNKRRRTGVLACLRVRFAYSWIALSLHRR